MSNLTRARENGITARRSSSVIVRTYWSEQQTERQTRDNVTSCQPGRTVVGEATGTEGGDGLGRPRVVSAGVQCCPLAAVRHGVVDKRDERPEAVGDDGSLHHLYVEKPGLDGDDLPTHGCRQQAVLAHVGPDVDDAETRVQAQQKWAGHYRHR